MTSIGHLRSGLTLNLGEAVWNNGPAQVRLGHGLCSGGLYVLWDGGGPTFLGYGYSERQARQVLGQAKAKELKTYRSWASGGAKLNHSPNGPSLLFPKAKP